MSGRVKRWQRCKKFVEARRENLSVADPTGWLRRPEPNGPSRALREGGPSFAGGRRFTDQETDRLLASKRRVPRSSTVECLQGGERQRRAKGATGFCWPWMPQTGASSASRWARPPVPTPSGRSGRHAGPPRRSRAGRMSGAPSGTSRRPPTDSFSGGRERDHVPLSSGVLWWMILQ